MMKIFFLFLIFSHLALCDETVYTVPQLKPEIELNNSAPPLKKYEGKRPQHLSYVGLLRGSLHYDLPDLTQSDSDFNPTLVGINVGKKNANHFFTKAGNLEFSGQWQRFKREISVYSQNVNVFQFNIIQNIDLATFKKILFLSAGFGIAPVYLDAEESVFGSSTSRLGGMGLLKADLMMAISQKYELVLGISSGWGNVGGEEIFIPSIHLGLNFEN